MPTYNSIIERSEAAALIPPEVSAEILQHVPQMSAAMRLARQLPNMSTNQRRMPVTSALASAYFVSGDNGLKQTSEVNWASKYIDAEELAVIVPIPEAVLNDSGFDIWGQVRPMIEEAFGKAIDQAVFYGTNIPASWTTNLGAAGLKAVATAAGQTISAAAFPDLYDAILGDGGAIGLIEADGFMATGHVAHPGFRSKLRSVRDADGGPIFARSMQGQNTYELDGSPILFPTNGAMVEATSWLITGDWSKLVYSMRQDITYKVLTEAVITDGAGAIVYNLAQQDMIALRAVMRLGFALPNPINPVNPTEATRCAFSVLTA